MAAFSAILLMLVLAATFVVNSGALDVVMKQRLEALFNEQYRGRLQLREVHLSFPDHITLVAPAVYEENSNTPALSASRISARFNFFSLLKPKLTTLSFQELDVQRFQGSILTGADGKLNLQRIFAERDPNKPKQFDIEAFRCRKLTVRNTSLLYVARNGQRYDLRDLDAEFTRFLVGKHELTGAMENLRFNVPNRKFRVSKASCTFTFSPKGSEIIRLDLVTNRSSAKLSVSFDGLNIFSGISSEQFRKQSAFVHLESLSLHTDDLGLIVETPRIPAGIYTLRGDAKGTLDDLKILPSVLAHDDSRLAFQGELLECASPKNFSFKLRFDKSHLSARLLGQLADSERMRQLAKDSGGIDFQGSVQGKPDQWLANGSFKSAIGSGSANVKAAHTGAGRYTASGTFALEKTEPGKIFDLKKAASGFSGSGSFNGTFSTAGTIEALHLEANVTSAFWQRQHFSSGRLVVDSRSRSLSTVANLQGTDGSAINVNASFDFSPGAPAYQAVGIMKKFDLSKVAGSNEFSTNLSGTFNIRGQGFDTASMNVHADMTFEPSAINDFVIQDRSVASLGVTQTPSATSVSLTSSFMDLSLQGNASLRQVLAAMQLASSGISRELGRASTQAPASLPQNPFAVNYRLTVRDSSPLGPLLNAQKLRFQGNASGKATYQNGQLAIDADATVSRLDAAERIHVSNASGTLAMVCTQAGIPSASLNGTVATAVVAGKDLQSLQFHSTYAASQLGATVDCAIPEYREKFSAALQARRNGSSTTVKLNRMTLTAPDGVWKTNPDAIIELGDTFVRFNRLNLTKGPQSIEFDGILSSSQPGTFQCTMSNIELTELRQLTSNTDVAMLSGRANAMISVSGRPGAKTSAFEFRGINVLLDDIRIGSVHLSGEHSGERLQFSFESRNPASSGAATAARQVNTIRGGGSLPLLLNYSPFRFEVPERRNMDISLHSDDLSARFLVFIVPLLDDADGVIPTDLHITGSLPNPDIRLAAHLNGTMIRVASTQVPYRVDGVITGNQSSLELGNLQMHDSTQGTGTVSGVVRLDGFKPKSVDLTASCRNLLLYNKKDLKDDTSFGTIRGTTGNFRLYGELTAPTAEGEFHITAADFSLYRKGSNESAKYIGVEKFIEFVPRYPERQPLKTTTVARSATTEFRQDLLDILQISRLRLTCNVPIRGTMIFDRIRGERIESSINNISLNVSKIRQRFSLFGSVDIVGGKYTLSNANFDLENGGRVVWNNQEIRDGALENLYGTKLTSASDAQTGERDNVKLLLAISGTINEPNVRMGYYLNDDNQPYASVNTIGSQASHIDPNADLNVISILLSRQWYIHPEHQGRSGNLAVSTVGVSAGTGMLSSQLSGMVQGLAGLESFNVNVGTGSNGNPRGIELNFALLVPGTGGKVRFIGSGNTPTTNTSGNANNYYASSQKLEYRVNPKVYIQAYRSYGQTGTESATTNLQGPTENWGASVSYRERFHTWNQFWHRLFGSGKSDRESGKNTVKEKKQ